MAENWAENTENDVQENLLDDPDTEAGANKDIDGMDEGAKPKRNRQLSAGNVDEIPDDSNPDDAPKPKRGRGRPRKDEDSQMSAMRRELDELKSENARLSDKARSFAMEQENLERDLDLTRSSLLEKEHDYADLLEQFSSHEENSQSIDKPTGLIFFDEITEACVSKLKPSITWNRVKKGLAEIDDSDNIKKADIVILLTGSHEIASGVSAFHLYQTLRRLIENCDQTQIFVVSLPPNNNARVQVDLYNHKLLNLEYDNVKPLKVKFLGSKLDLVSYNGFTPSVRCISFYEEIFQSIPVPTILKSKETATHLKPLDFDVTAVIPIRFDMVGRVIGRNGAVIKRITTSCNVKISFGTWKERNSDSRDDESDSFTAAMIKGRVGDVQHAISEINGIIKSSKQK